MLVLLDWDMHGRGPPVRQKPVRDLYAPVGPAEVAVDSFALSCCPVAEVSEVFVDGFGFFGALYVLVGEEVVSVVEHLGCDFSESLVFGSDVVVVDFHSLASG